MKLVFVFALIATYIAFAVVFYAVMARTAPVMFEDAEPRPLLFVIDGQTETDSRKAA